MKLKKITGILLIVLGVAAFAHQGITWKTREEAIDLGPVPVLAQKPHTIPLPPLIGGALWMGGIALLVLSPKRI